MTRPPEPLPSARAGRARRLAALGVAALAAAVSYGLVRLLGFRSAAFAFTLHFTWMGAAASIDQILAPELSGPRFDVSPRELRLYRRLGVIGFMRLLRRIGWTRLLRDRSVFDGSRRTLHAYERATRHGENAHAWLFLLALAPIAWALTRGWWDAAWWIGSMNVLFHAYPVMLQRTQRARLRGLIERRRSPAASRLGS